MPAGRAVAEAQTGYATQRRKRTRYDTIHAIVERDEGMFVAECLELAAVTQGRSLDEVVSNLREAIELYMQGEDLKTPGLSRRLRLSVTFELGVGPDAGKA